MGGSGDYFDVADTVIRMRDYLPEDVTEQAREVSLEPRALDLRVGDGIRIAGSWPDYRLDIYRLGYYGGLGARLVTTVQPSATLPQTPYPIYQTLKVCETFRVSFETTSPSFSLPRITAPSAAYRPRSRVFLGCSPLERNLVLAHFRRWWFLG